MTSVRNLLWKIKNNLNLRDAATFGYPPSRNSVKRPPFLRKHSREPQLHSTLRSRIRNEGGGSVPDRCTSKKAPLPDLHNNPPKYGLKSDTDYITANAVMVIRAKPNRPQKEPPMSDPGFGRIPAYLAKRKEQIRSTSKDNSPESEGKCHHPGTRRLEDDEKQTIVNGLKIKWANVNAEYLRLPFIADTDAKAIRKNRYEQELENLQRDISMLSRKVVLVSDQKGLPSKVKPPLL